MCQNRLQPLQTVTNLCKKPLLYASVQQTETHPKPHFKKKNTTSSHTETLPNLSTNLKPQTSQLTKIKNKKQKNKK